MRYYDLQLSNSSGAIVKHWTSHPNGNQAPPDPGALKVEIDAYDGPQHTPLPGTYVRVWGISLNDIGQAANLNGTDLVLKGGMGKGLPLANPAEAGTLIQGHVQQAFANWVGTTMTLDLIVVAGSIVSGTGAAQNLVVNWPAGMPLSQVLKNTLQTAIPGAKLNINISPKLVLPYPELHFAATWPQLADYLVQQSRRILNTGPALAAMWNTPQNAQSTYPGVQLHLDGDTINVFDGTQPSAPKQITIYDLVGQPTWIKPLTIQVTCVMRGDLGVGDNVTLPPTRATVTAAAQSQASQQRQDVLFNGSFMITNVHHVGNYKDSGALSWVTVFDMTVNTTTNAQGQVALQTSTPPQAPTPAGGPAPNVVTIEDISSPAFDGAAAGLGPQQPAPSLQVGGAVSGAVAQQPAPLTASTAGLRQSFPAPSLGQSVSVGLQ